MFLPKKEKPVISHKDIIVDPLGLIPLIIKSEMDNKLVNDEKNIYKLIQSKLLMACSKPLVESMTKVIYEYDGFDFFANGKTVLDEGFRKYSINLQF